MPRARATIAWPSAVNVTLWVSRTNSRRPAACSRRRICWLTVDWLRSSLRPASLKLAALATAMKVVSSVGSNMGRLSSFAITATMAMRVHNRPARPHLSRQDFILQAPVKDMLARLRPDEFTLAMAATVTIALVLPCYGAGAEIFAALTSAAIGLLFFLQGARLSRGAVVAGASHWRLHLVIFTATFVLFPLAGLALRPLASALLAPPMVLGLIFLCALPSTVQTSIAFTSIAGGNVAAALCSASASSLVGMAITPLLAGLLLHAHGGFSLDALRSIAFELLAPFVAGQALQRWIGGFVQRHRKMLGMVDRGSVLLMVYTVFSAATVGGIWHQLTPGLFAILAAVDAA